MKRHHITLTELDEHLNRRDCLVFDYLIDPLTNLFIEELNDYVTDVVEKDDILYVVGKEVQHPLSKYSYSPWYEVTRIFPVRHKMA